MATYGTKLVGQVIEFARKNLWASRLTQDDLAREMSLHWIETKRTTITNIEAWGIETIPSKNVAALSIVLWFRLELFSAFAVFASVDKALRTKLLDVFYDWTLPEIDRKILQEQELDESDLLVIVNHLRWIKGEIGETLADQWNLRHFSLEINGAFVTVSWPSGFQINIK